LVAPAGPLSAERLHGARQALEARGLEVALRDDADAREGYLAGSDQRRLCELRDALLDPQIRAVFLARGGYGVQRLLDGLDLPRDLAPKAVVGFSDNTALLHHLQTALGWGVLHGPHPQAHKAEELDRVLACLGLDGSAALPAFSGLSALNGGAAVEGPIDGGCLSLLCASLSTPEAFCGAGKIVFLEDVGEPSYRLDRMLNQLLRSGALTGALAVVFGQPATFLPEGADPAELTWLLSDVARRLPVPVLTGLPCGHVADHHPLPLGPRARLTPTTGELCLLEPLVR
jgi:muramoyltetrapeptide carboxypeptidase